MIKSGKIIGVMSNNMKQYPISITRLLNNLTMNHFPARLHIPRGYCKIKVPQTRLDRHPVMDLLALVVKQEEAATRSPCEKIKGCRLAAVVYIDKF